MSSDEEFDEDAYVIQYNGFRDNYIENIRRCYTAKLLTDAQLVTVDSKVFDVHRVVLSANSAFFFDTFQRLGNRPSGKHAFSKQNIHITRAKYWNAENSTISDFLLFLK